MRKTRVALLTSVVALVAAAPAAAGEKDLCTKGGYEDYTTNAGGAPFEIQGQCVSFVARGGRSCQS